MPKRRQDATEEWIESLSIHLSEWYAERTTLQKTAITLAAAVPLAVGVLWILSLLGGSAQGPTAGKF